MKIISLDGAWQLRGKQQNAANDEFINLTATVPGCVQLDLSAQGFLPDDLYMGENILQAEKYESYEWWYERTFSCPERKENVYLVFEGVDCLASYYINGKKLGETQNSLIAHEFKIDEFLCDGENTLTVHIRSALLDANEHDYPIRLMHGANVDGRYLRKPPHSYGWDIMPRAVTSGLWRGVRLELRDDLYFSQAFVWAQKERVLFHYAIAPNAFGIGNVEIELQGSCGDSSFELRRAVKCPCGKITFKIDNPKLWYPYGYGDANVYDCTARIFKDGNLIHEEPLSFGIRDIVLDRRDPSGLDAGQFRFVINGVEIMCRGSNWVPMDAFHCRDAERYAKALELVKDVGCNILRCWGGNVYEDHAFFDFCDRNGIMIWQDFTMACGLYPETPEFMANLQEEVTSVIRKLRNHPSIILWAGDNEVDALYPEFDPNKNKITRELIPNCVRDNDLGRPYLPSSPYISPEMHAARDIAVIPEDHLWGPRDYFKSDFYKNNGSHFVSETGYHGCPSLESIKKFISPDKVWPYHNNSEWILHSSDQNGHDGRVMLMEKQVRQLFGNVPTDPEEYILASQISQAEAKKYFIERIRVGRPQKTGIIWWNLLDGWPQMSDAVVDYYYNKKLAYEYIKRSQAPFAIIADEIKSWNITLYACNDTLSIHQGHLTVKDALTGEILHECDFVAPENTSTPIAKLPIYYSEQKMLILEWTANGERGFNHYLCGYPPISLEAYRSVIEKYNL